MLLSSSDGQFSMRDRFLALKHDDTSGLLPWLMACTGPTVAVRHRVAMETHPWRSIARMRRTHARRRGGVQDASRPLPAEKQVQANEETFYMVHAKFGMKDGRIMATAAEAAIGTSR